MTSRTPRTGGRRFVAAIALTLAMTACGAPESKPARGPIAEQVKASLDSGTEPFDNALWGRLLAGGSRDGLVDYAYFREHREDLEAYLDAVAAADLALLAPDHLEALLINAYNALTIRSILDNPGVSSIREIDGVWKKARHRVGGFDLTLDAIEHNLLRPTFKDPRIHFAVNCASMSCAPLPGWAFEGNRLEEQLDERTRSFLTDPENIRVDGDSLVVSRYFQWYGDDFTKEGWEPRGKTIGGFIARYATPEVAAFIRKAGDRPSLEFMEYDWALNVVQTPTP